MDPRGVQPSTQRALAAIVLTDAVSFSARMSVDEEGTLALIQRDLNLMADLCHCHDGQVLKSTGDGLLMSFVSAVQAVRCSQAIQKKLAHEAEGLLPQEYLQHRIGIHLGDVLFSHGDVLGNGVNIAARLQTQSTPGGICISQTVYDVVKSRLRLRATFLGPLNLKNIKEPIPAFQIPPSGQSATMLMAGPPALEMLSADAPLAQAVEALQTHAQNHRIKKLIYCLCQGSWENDPVVLSQFKLLALIKTLRQKYPTPSVLEAALKALVARLNRKAKYQAIADVILQRLTPILAADDRPATQAKETILIDQKSAPYVAIAAALQAGNNPIRIKKLLYATIHNKWESEAAALSQYEMADLIAQVYEVAPTEVDLNQRLENIVRRLSQPARYTPLALLITESFQPLYKAAARQHFLASNAAGGEATASESTPMPISDPSAGDEAPTSVTCLEGGSQFPNSQIPGVANPAVASTESVVAAKPRDRANIYNLRLEIMRYTNPLRAKILLLSTLNGPFTFSQQDWIVLKSKALDDLVQDVFEYCSNYADLESKLTIMSHCVENAEESTQTAGVILKAMRPFYPLAKSAICS